MDLKITQARRIGHDGYWDIAIADGQIQAIAPVIEAPCDQTIDAQRSLVIPGLVDAHIHLDKALLLDRCPAQAGTFAEALQETLRLKQGFTVEDIRQRARHILEGAIAHGITAMRSHVEVDPVVQLTALEALLPLRSEYDWGITLQLAIFAQEGITNMPGTLELLQQAMELGGDVIGSAPYVDPDPEKNVRLIFELAQRFNCDIDFHLDFLDDDEPLLLPFVIAETVKHDWQGRVCLGHMTKLAGLPPDRVAAIAPSLAEAGISILALPASDLYMMGRRDAYNTRRGVAPLQHLAQFGVNVGLATNNVQNLFTPFGDGDVLKIATLAAQTLHLGTPDQHRLVMDMVTTNAAQAIGIDHWGVEPGAIADLVIINAASLTELVGVAPVDRTVIKRGRVVSQRTVQHQFAPLLPTTH
jgi:cytosine deaminase